MFIMYTCIKSQSEVNVQFRKANKKSTKSQQKVNKSQQKVNKNQKSEKIEMFTETGELHSRVTTGAPT